MKLIGHKYLNTQKKNNQRDQHGYQWKLKKNKIKDHQEHLWHKMSWAKKFGNFILQKERENRTHPIHCLNLKALSSFVKGTTYLSDLKIWITHQSILYIQDEEARDYDRENINEACVDKQVSVEVAVVGEWDIGGDFTRNTFCLVLGNK